MTKAAQLSLSRVFADQYAGDNVLVNAVAPGAVGSELWTGPDGLAEQIAEARGGSRDDALAAQAAKIPLGRLGVGDVDPGGPRGVHHQRTLGLQARDHGRPDALAATGDDRDTA